MQHFNVRPSFDQELQSSLAKMETAMQAARRWQAADTSRRTKNPPVPDTISYLVEGITRYCEMGKVALEMKAQVEAAIIVCSAAASELAAPAPHMANVQPFWWGLTRGELMDKIASLRQCLTNLTPSIAASSEGFNNLAQRINVFYPIESSKHAEARVGTVERK
jgi:hypothetical protein